MFRDYVGVVLKLLLVQAHLPHAAERLSTADIASKNLYDEPSPHEEHQVNE